LLNPSIDVSLLPVPEVEEVTEEEVEEETINN